MKYAVYENLGAQILQMPFRTSNLTMFILMPVECQNFNEMQQALNDFDLQALNGGEYHNVNIILPRFSAAVSFELNSVMSYVRFFLFIFVFIVYSEHYFFLYLTF